MKRLVLGPVAAAVACVVLALAGCGDTASDTSRTPSDQPSSATSSASSSAPSSAPGSPDSSQARTIAIVHDTAAGGRVDLTAVPVDDEAARQEFTAQFTRGSLDHKIARAVAGADLPAAYSVVAAVVAIGCDVPPGVTAEQGADGWVLTPQKVPSPLQECFAPVTSVAVVAVPAVFS